MIIGYDAKRLFNNFTGLGNYSRNLLNNLLLFASDNQYHLYTPKIKSSAFYSKYLTKTNCHIHLPKNKINPLWRSFNITNHLKKDHIEIFHGLSHELPLNINKINIKKIVTIHDLIFNVFPEQYKLADRLIYNKKYRHSCNAADHIIAISESTKKDIINQYQIPPEKISVIYQSCDPLFHKLQDEYSVQRTKKKYDIPEDYILNVGSVISRKNLMNIVRAYDLVPKDLQIPLVVVGKGKKYKKRIIEYLKKNRINHLVIFIDNLTDNNELQALYQGAKVFIYASLYEGFGIPVIESLMSKTAVITSDTSSLPEAAGPGGHYVFPSDPYQMSEGIKKVLQDDSYRNKLIEDGYDYVKKAFYPQNITNQLINTYNNLQKQPHS